MTNDDLSMLGVDGIRRSFDEHYDTMMDVEQDPCGAHHAIHNQHARIEELEAKNAQLGKVLAELVTCVEDGCFCSEMVMASAIDESRAALKENHDEIPK